MPDTINIINIRDINNINSVNSPWVSSPDSVEEGVRAAFRLADSTAQIRVIGTLAELDELISSSSERCLIVNAHGESFPKPERWASWEQFFTRLGENIRDRGWILTSVTGVPLFYYGTPERAVHEVNAQGYTGLNIVFSAVNARILQIVATVAMQTGEGLRATRIANLPLPRQHSFA